MSYRDPDGYSYSSRSLLANALESDMQTDEERELLAEYHSILKAIEEDQARLQEIRGLLRKSSVDSELDTSINENFGALLESVAKRIDINDRKLIKLQATTALKKVIERERRKLDERLKQ